MKRFKNFRSWGALAVATCLAASAQGYGSSLHAEKGAPEPYIPPLKTVASIKELMDSTVDPAADGVWDAVATIVTEKGVDQREPRTDEEWHEVRRHAITLIEAMNLVMMDGRRVAPTGTKPGLGEQSPEQIGAMIAANRPAFDQFAESVRSDALRALDAIDRKDSQALFRIGSDMDESCEGCHVTFWYPNSARPTG